MPDEITQKYEKYLNRIPGNVLEKPLQFLNYTIQSINLPGMGYDAVIQQKKPGLNVQYRSTIPRAELFEKELTVTFQLADGYVNYWMMLDILDHYYRFDVREPYIDDLNVRILDAEGQALVTARLIRPLIKSMGELNMSFASNTADFNTFDINIGYNDLEIIVELI